ncbi:MAG: hypothetical protein QOH05_3337 [Acetobacteraceae bacterium]|nr:hypothetical protein [Acetobacteraceae bacterium]
MSAERGTGFKKGSLDCRVRPHLKVLFIAGYAENAVVGNGRLDTRMRVITKPFSMAALAPGFERSSGAEIAAGQRSRYQQREGWR